jgi:hypothetical protein
MKISELTESEIQVLTDRLLSNTVPVRCQYDHMSDCLVWTGNKTSKDEKHGYARTKIKGRMVLMHRFSYFIANQSINDSLFVCHKCDAPSCVNPDHLFLGTPKDNMVDKTIKGRCRAGFGDRHGSKTMPWSRARGLRNGYYTRPDRRVILRGEQTSGAKLTEADVRLILKMKQEGMRNCDIADQFNVNRPAISLIVNGKSWSHVFNAFSKTMSHHSSES